MNVLGSSDVYGPVLPEQPLILREQRLSEMQAFSLRELVTLPDSMGSTAEEYPHLSGAESAYDMMQELFGVIAH